MLDDTARKLLRIMYHFSNHFRRMPTLPELAKLSGRTPAGIYSGFRELVLEGHIQWQPQQPIESAVILVAWETPEPGAHTSISGHWKD
ncbi:hypothetical protein [Paenibacillus sp. IHBB 3054]|uniref:hypothetical protein n=1 Tax=Paenibacillus sp. IHBB 3054 TaxID=3425689 RepID=UPI003F664C9B